MSNETENIQWEIMDDEQPKSFFKNPIKLQTPKKQPEKDYRNLYDEMLEKCNPALFLEPYNPEKLAVANEIYFTLKQYEQEYNVLDKDIPQELRLLRNKAALSLEISFTTKRLFEFLEKRLHPKQFVNENYHKELLELSNDVYNELLQHSNDIISLEKFHESEKCQLYLNRRETFYKKIQEEKEEKERREELIAAAVVIGIGIFAMTIMILCICTQI